MAKLSRKELMEGRENCKALLASIERELAATYSENSAVTFKAAGGASEKDTDDTAEKSPLAFETPDMKSAILDTRRRPLAPAFVG